MGLSKLEATVTRKSWRSFRKVMGIVQLDPKSQSRPDGFHFAYSLNNHQYYPRIHFVCQYTNSFARIEAHIDISRHTTQTYRDEILLKFHQALLSWDKAYNAACRLIAKKNQLPSLWEN